MSRDLASVGESGLAPGIHLEGHPGSWPMRCWARWNAWMAGRRARPAALTVAGRLELGAKKSLLVVVCGGRRFLVGVGAESVSALLEISPRAAVTRWRLDRREPRLSLRPGKLWAKKRGRR